MNMQTKSRKFLSVLLALLMMAGVIAVAPVVAHAAQAPTITTTSLPNATAGVFYSYTLEATGGPTGWTWHCEDEGIFNGFAVRNTGVFDGTPLAAGTFYISFQADNDAGYSEWKTLTLVVDGAPVTNYTVTYNTDGGTPATIAPVTVASGTAITLPAAPAKSGSIFKGWKDGITTYAAGASYTVTANKTFTAQWAKTIFSTRYEATILNWLLFFVGFGFIWMWF